MMSDTKTVMTDWSGLPVHVGDTIIFISTVQPRIFSQMKYLDPETSQLCQMRVMPNAPQIWVWNETWESEITEVEGLPHIKAPMPNPMTGEPSSVLIPVHMFWDMYCDQNGFTGNTFAIKGISDNHEKYFRNFFRRGIRNNN